MPQAREIQLKIPERGHEISQYSLSWTSRSAGRDKTQLATPLGIEYPGVVSQLRERCVPFQPSQHLLGPCIRERGLGSEKIEHRANSCLVAGQCNLTGSLGTGDQIIGGTNPPGRRLKTMVGAEYLEDHLLTQCLGPGAGCVGQRGRLALVV